MSPASPAGSEVNIAAKPPPDAGRSYLGQYGMVGNAWFVWALNGDPEFVMQTPAQIRRGLRPPRCPGAHDPHRAPPRMKWRPGAWKCYEHDEPIVIEIQTKLPRCPRVDVLSRLDEALDYRWNDRERRYEVVTFGTSQS